jgi:hypothetical protein
LDGPRGIKNKIIQKVGVHVCTEEEWANLYPAKDELDKNVISIIKDS